MKKYLNVSFLLNFITISTFGFLFLDSFFYFGFCQKHFLINSRYFLIFYLILISIFFIFKKISISPIIIKLNKIFFPISLSISIFFTYLEKINYTNFVYTYLHLDPINFLYLPFLSGLIICIYNYQFFKKNFYYLIPLIATYLIQSLSFSLGFRINILPTLMAIIINYFLWLIILFLLTSFFKKRYLSLIVFSSFFSILTLINRYKIKFLNHFFTINDINLVKELNNFLPSAIKQLGFKEILILIGIILLLISLMVVLKKKLKTKNPSFKIRSILFIVSTFVLIFPVIFPNQFKQIIKNFKIDVSIANPIDNCKNNGILFCFYDDFKNIRNPPPKDYNQQSINQIYSNIEKDLPSSREVPEHSEGSGFKPNIIVILSEALWDATQLPEVKYSQDPIKNIRADIKSTFISPVFGNMTANVEFGLLTGLSNYFLNGSVPYSQSVRQSMPSLFTAFKDEGYLTTAIHPFYASTYNRPTVYKYFGLDKFISIEDMSEYENAGPYVSAKSFTQEILKQFNSTDQSQFIFALSMQNHFPFESNRFPNHKIEIKSSLEPDNKDVLQTYIDGINLSDEYYAFLKQEIIKSKKPTIVIVFGDHLPLLNSDFDIYKKTGFDINNQTKMHSTPIAAFANFQTNFDFPKEMSPNFLSLEILKSANILPKYQFAYLKSISNTSTVLNLNIPNKFTPDQLENYELIQYDLLFGKQFLLK